MFFMFMTAIMIVCDVFKTCHKGMVTKGRMHAFQCTRQVA